MANAINWFEIPVNNFDKAKNFYEKVFNSELTTMEMGPMKMAMFPWEQGGAGSTGALVKAETYVPSYNGSMVYFSVDDIDGTLNKVTENGGKTLNPKMSIGEYGFVAHFEDCEGNRVALHSIK